MATGSVPFGAPGASFRVDLDRLLGLQSRLGSLQQELLAPHLHPTSLAESLNPLRSSSPLTAHDRSEVSTFAYGMLAESDPLGHAHALVSESVVAMLSDLLGMVDAMIALARSKSADYQEAEAAVSAAVGLAAGDGGYGASS